MVGRGEEGENFLDGEEEDRGERWEGRFEGEERGEARGCLTPPGACSVSSSSMKSDKREEEDVKEEDEEEGDEGGREEEVDPQGRLCSSQPRGEVNFAANFSLQTDPLLRLSSSLTPP